MIFKKMKNKKPKKKFVKNYNISIYFTFEFVMKYVIIITAKVDLKDLFIQIIYILLKSNTLN